MSAAPRRRGAAPPRRWSGGGRRGARLAGRGRPPGPGATALAADDPRGASRVRAARAGPDPRDAGTGPAQRDGRPARLGGGPGRYLPGADQAHRCRGHPGRGGGPVPRRAGARAGLAPGGPGDRRVRGVRPAHRGRGDPKCPSLGCNCSSTPSWAPARWARCDRGGGRRCCCWPGWPGPSCCSSRAGWCPRCPPSAAAPPPPTPPSPACSGRLACCGSRRRTRPSSAALNAAWDDLASRWVSTSGRVPTWSAWPACSNKTHPLTEAAVTWSRKGSGRRPG